MIVGIDLGTTNSLVAIWRDGQAQLIPNSLGEVAKLEGAGIAVVLFGTWFLFGAAIGLVMALNNEIRSASLLRGKQ